MSYFPLQVLPEQVLISSECGLSHSPLAGAACPSRSAGGFCRDLRISFHRVVCHGPVPPGHATLIHSRIEASPRHSTLLCVCTTLESAFRAFQASDLTGAVLRCMCVTQSRQLTSPRRALSEGTCHDPRTFTTSCRQRAALRRVLAPCVRVEGALGGSPSRLLRMAWPNSNRRWPRCLDSCLLPS